MPNDFGVSRKRLSKEDERRAHKIAQKHDCELIVVEDLPGTGYQRWFSGASLGFIHDDAVKDAVLNECQDVGVDL